MSMHDNAMLEQSQCTPAGLYQMQAIGGLRARLGYCRNSAYGQLTVAAVTVLLPPGSMWLASASS